MNPRETSWEVKKWTVRQGAATAAVLAGLAVGTAGAASAVPTMSGHHIASETLAGSTFTDDWQVTACADGCVSVVIDRAPAGQARLANGQWTRNAVVSARGNDGAAVSSGGQVLHDVWDANTPAGTEVPTRNPGETPNPKGFIILYLVAWPWYVGAYLAVQFGAAEPSLARTITGWVFEVPWLVVLAWFAFYLLPKARKRGR